MSFSYRTPRYQIVRDLNRCIECGICVRQCANEAHTLDPATGKLGADDAKCVNCHRCVLMCPTRALVIRDYPLTTRPNDNWTQRAIDEIQMQADTGGILLSAMGTPNAYPVYWDKILLNASQVTNPPIDPLREPMETRVYLGRKPEKLEIQDGKITTRLSPQIELAMPVMFSAMSFGSISLQAQKAIARAAKACGIMFNVGEGGFHKDLQDFADHAIVQVASGRYGVSADYLHSGGAVEIKIGQGAKPGIGGHLPGSKVNADVSTTRMIPEGTDAISPAPHHDIYSIEDLRQLIYAIKEATEYQKPISVKVAAVHNVAAIVSGVARAGADIIAIDGFRGGTGAAPTRIRDNVGIPIELALAAADERLRKEGIRNDVSLVAAGSIRNSADIVKAIALGADAVYIGSAALIAMGCHMCGTCNTGKCNWGIATQREELTRRLNPDVAAERLCNLLRAWHHEIDEMLGEMGLNAIEALRGNRRMLRGIGLTQKELDILGIAHAGE